MATRYWVGGTGNWDTTTTNWSTTSGGSNGASVPTAADDVVFDTLSNATGYTVTLTPAATFTASVAGTVMTVTAVQNGTLAVGQNIDIFGQLPTTISISSLGTGSGGVGTYNINVSRTLGSQNMNSNVPVCNSCTVAAPLTGAISLTSAAGTFWDIYGNFILPATNCTVNTNVNPFFIPSTAATFTTNSVTLGTIQLFGTGSLSFGSAADIIAIYMYASGFVTNNYSLTSRVVSSQQTTANIIVTLGTSTVNMYSNSNFNVATGNTLNAGTSTINFSGSTPSVGGTSTNPVFTYYNVNFTNTSSNTVTVNGTNTFNNFSVSTVTTLYSISYIYFGANQTINGTLTMSGASYTQRLFVESSTFATSITLTVAAVSALSYIDFGSITVAGASAPWSGTSLGNLQNNVNITTSTPKTVYWNAPNVVGNWSPSNGTIVWATSSGGATSAANFPLAQDTCIFDNTGLGTTGTVNYDRNWSLGNINFSAVTNPATFSIGSYPAFYLDVIFSSSLTLTQTTGTYALFLGAGTQALTSAGLAFPAGILAGQRGASTSTFNLIDAARCVEGFGLGAGALNLNGCTLTCGYFASSGTITRSIAFGLSGIYLTANNNIVLQVQNLTNYTYTGTPNFYSTYSGSVGTRSFYIGSTASSESNVPNVLVTAGTDTISFGINCFLGTLNTTGFTGTITNASAGLRVFRDLVVGAGATWNGASANLYFVGTAVGQNITTNAVSINSFITFTSTQVYSLQGALTCTNLVTLTSGTLNLNNYNLTSSQFNSTNTNTRSIVFGTGQVYVTGPNAYIINLDNMTGFTYTGSGVFNATFSGSGPGFRGIVFANGGGGTEANSLSINVTAGTDQVQIYGLAFKNINLTGFAGTWIEAGTRNIYGDLTISTGMTVTATTTTQFTATSGTQNITSNGKTLTFPITKITGAGTLRLVDALTISSNKSFQLQTGTLNLNGNSLTCGYFEASSSNVTINFSGANIYVSGTGPANVFYVNAIIAYTGIPNIYFTGTGTAGNRGIWGNNAAYPLNYFITGGTDNIVLITTFPYGPINFTGFGGTLAALTTTINLIGDLTFSSSMTFAASSGNLRLSGTGIQNITSNGITINIILTLAGSGSYVLQDNATVNSVTYYTSLSSGTLNLNGRTLSSGLASSGSSVRSIAFNGGKLVIPNTGVGAFNASGSNFSTSGTGVISMTNASAKGFQGGGFSYPTISQDGAGALTITGANTFRTIANTVAPATITLPASTITSVAGFDLIGSAGNLITLNSSTSGTRATINNTTGGRIGGDYLSYQDTNATPASTISAGANSTSVSNNTGWLTTPVEFGTTAESYTLAEDITVLREQFGTTTESITLSNTQASQADFKPTNAESLTLADAQSTQVSFAPTNAETLTLANTQSSQVSFVSTNAEAITLADAQAGIRGQFGTTAESITLTNTQAAIVGFFPQIAELLTLTELISIQSNLVGYTAETIVFTDTQIQRGWTKIINNQTPNWTNINDYQ